MKFNIKKERKDTNILLGNTFVVFLLKERHNQIRYKCQILTTQFAHQVDYWRASVASETLTGVKMKKSGMFVCIYVWTYVCHFVL